MRKSVIIDTDGSINTSYGTADNNPNEYPPPHGLTEGAVAVMLHDNDCELCKHSEDHDGFHKRLRDCEYKAGQLIKDGQPLKVQCVEKMRMIKGALQDNTTTGWRRRIICEPVLDDDGEEIEDEDGNPICTFYTMGPWQPETGEPNLCECPEGPGPEDRMVYRGSIGAEVEIEMRAAYSKTAQIWRRC